MAGKGREKKMVVSLIQEPHERRRSIRIQAPLILIILIILIALLSNPSMAHSPKISTGDVVIVPDAETSYAWYGLLGGPDETDLYRISAEEGTELRISTSSPDPGTAPPFAVIGPGITTMDLLPPGTSIPEGYGSIVVPVPDIRQPPSYEPFTPMALYEGASLSLPAPASGDYTVAVSGTEGRYILATGFLEAFTLAEWVLIPVMILSVRAWQGQSLVANLLPMIGAILIGAWWFHKRIPPASWPWAWLPAVAGFAFIGSGILVIIQMVLAGLRTGPVPSMLLTLLFAAIPVILGVLLVRIAAQTDSSPLYRERAAMAILGILGLVFWAGLIVGPILAIAASVMPGAGTSGAS
jgi:hypothetical protein